MALETRRYVFLDNIKSPSNGKMLWVHKAQNTILEANPKLIRGKWFLRVMYLLCFI